MLGARGGYIFFFSANFDVPKTHRYNSGLTRKTRVQPEDSTKNLRNLAKNSNKVFRVLGKVKCPMFYGVFIAGPGFMFHNFTGPIFYRSFCDLLRFNSA